VSDKKIKVPDGMLKAVLAGEHAGCTSWAQKHYLTVLESALRWLSENPIVPTIEQLKAINAAWHEGNHLALGTGETSFVLIEFQRRMFLAPEPEIPPEIKDLLSPTCQNLWEPSRKEYDAAVLEAFNRGRRLGKGE